MFDPERDDDRGDLPFYLRVLAVAAITIAGCAALWPSVHGFSAGLDHQTSCLPITDGWDADRPAPSASELATVQAVFPPPPTAAEQADPAAMAQWRAQFQAAQANPAVQRAYGYDTWAAGPGACVHESRHLLIHTGIGLGALGALVAGVVAVRRTRTSLRHTPAKIAGA